MQAAELAYVLREGAELREVAEAAEATGHASVAVEGLREPLTISGIELVPRLTTRDLSMLRRFKGLRAYPVEKAEDLRSYPRLRRYAHIITMTGNALRRLGPREVERLSNLGLPVEVQVNTVLEALASGLWLRGLRALLTAALTDRVKLATSSGAFRPQLIRPVEVKRAFLEVFGLTQSHTFEAVITVPANVLGKVVRS